ncbi:hypothetical protein Pfo_009518 [Paulownia fortunei]|nr:hypothetical protein Pfo_009518 [Paulownia fortunei]
MDPMQRAGTGLLGHMSPTGKLTQAFHLHHQDGISSSNLSPSDISPAQKWTPPAIQEINTDDYDTSRGDVGLRPRSFSPTMEGTSAAGDSRGSTSSRSESNCDYESMVKAHFSHRNFASRHCFINTPKEATGIAPAGLSGFNAITPHRDRHHLSNASASVDLTEIPESMEYDLFSRSHTPSDCFRCGLCERLLSQRSPWSSLGIVKSGDMPVAGVLSCCHVFHAECLEQTTAKAHRNDPPCPICAKIEENYSQDQRAFSKLRSTFPRLKPCCEDWPSKPLACAQSGDCVEGAAHAPTWNTLLSLNRSRFGKHLSSEGNPAREFPGKFK